MSILSKASTTPRASQSSRGTELKNRNGKRTLSTPSFKKPTRSSPKEEVWPATWTLFSCPSTSKCCRSISQKEKRTPPTSLSANLTVTHFIRKFGRKGILPVVHMGQRSKLPKGRKWPFKSHQVGFNTSKPNSSSITHFQSSRSVITVATARLRSQRQLVHWLPPSPPLDRNRNI